MRVLDYSAVTAPTSRDPEIKLLDVMYHYSDSGFVKKAAHARPLVSCLFFKTTRDPKQKLAWYHILRRTLRRLYVQNVHLRRGTIKYCHVAGSGRHMRRGPLNFYLAVFRQSPSSAQNNHVAQSSGACAEASVFRQRMRRGPLLCSGRVYAESTLITM
jgi:hypothetical protein